MLILCNDAFVRCYVSCKLCVPFSKYSRGLIIHACIRLGTHCFMNFHIRKRFFFVSARQDTVVKSVTAR